MEEVVRRLLAHQDANDEHTWLTRIVVSAIIVFANAVLYGVYGAMGSVVFYLAGVELAGLPLRSIFVPFGVMLAYGAWKSLHALADYWRNYGHG